MIHDMIFLANHTSVTRMAVRLKKTRLNTYTMTIFILKLIDQVLRAESVIPTCHTTEKNSTNEQLDVIIVRRAHILRDPHKSLPNL